LTEPHKTADLLLLLKNRAGAIKDLALNVKAQSADRCLPSQLSLVALLSGLSSGLLSRGSARSSGSKAIKNFMDRWSCPQSLLTLFPLVLKVNYNGHFSLIPPFSDHVLMDIFQRDYKKVTKSVSLAQNTVQEHVAILLEVSFGFVSQSINTPGISSDAPLPVVLPAPECIDFSLAYFDCHIETTGSFNHVMSAFRSDYVNSYFAFALVRYWIVDLFQTDAALSVVRQANIRNHVDSLRLGEGSLLSIFHVS
jgi:hypothetical protein